MFSSIAAKLNPDLTVCHINPAWFGQYIGDGDHPTRNFSLCDDNVIVFSILVKVETSGINQQVTVSLCLSHVLRVN